MWRFRVTILHWKHNNAFCVGLVGLYVTVNYIQILSVVSNDLVANFVTDNNVHSILQVSEINYIPTNFHSFRTVWLNRS